MEEEGGVRRGRGERKRERKKAGVQSWLRLLTSSSTTYFTESWNEFRFSCSDDGVVDALIDCWDYVIVLLADSNDLIDLGSLVVGDSKSLEVSCLVAFVDSFESLNCEGGEVKAKRSASRFGSNPRLDVDRSHKKAPQSIQ